MLFLPILMERNDFEPRGAALQALDEFKMESGAVRFWLSEDEKLTQSETSLTARKVLYDRYGFWSLENDYKPKTSAELYKSLRALGFAETMSGASRYFNGIEVTASVVSNHFAWI
jgi:phage/plasmid-associated DNA primase